MGDSPGSVERAAVWYVGAFAALGAVILTGIPIAGVDWSQLNHPAIPISVMALAALAAFSVVTLAARVIAPGCTTDTLTSAEEKIRKILAEKSPASPPTWEDIASSTDGVLRAVFVSEDNFGQPSTLWATARSGDSASRALLARMVGYANEWTAQKRFRTLRRVTPLAGVLILGAGLAWKPLTTPDGLTNVTSVNPVSVQVTLTSQSSPQAVFHDVCTRRILQGTALLGDAATGLYVAFPPQGDCAAAITDITPSIGIVTRS